VSAADGGRWSAVLPFSVCTERRRNRGAEKRKQGGLEGWERYGHVGRYVCRYHYTAAAWWPRPKMGGLAARASVASTSTAAVAASARL
jgi:hypothetical protein